MVHAVIAAGPRRYVAGVFSGVEEAAALVRESAKGRGIALEVVSAPNVDFPCFVVETTDRLRVVSDAGLSEVLGEWAAGRPVDPDYVFGNVYCLFGAWRPEDPAVDQMGAIRHVHVDRGLLDSYESGGLREFLRRWMSDSNVANALGR